MIFKRWKSLAFDDKVERLYFYFKLIILIDLLTSVLKLVEVYYGS